MKHLFYFYISESEAGSYTGDYIAGKPQENRHYNNSVEPLQNYRLRAAGNKLIWRSGARPVLFDPNSCTQLLQWFDPSDSGMIVNISNPMTLYYRSRFLCYYWCLFIPYNDKQTYATEINTSTCPIQIITMSSQKAFFYSFLIHVELLGL